MYQIVAVFFRAGAPGAHLLTEREVGIGESNKIAQFPSVSAARSVIKDWKSGTYYRYEHGSYRIVKDYSVGPDCIRGHYANEIDPKHIPPQVKKALDGASVAREETPHDSTYLVFSARVYRGNKRYAIKFTVSSVAAQINADDLSRIDWDEPVYTCRVV